MEFVTLVQIRPRANGGAASRQPDTQAIEWQQWKKQITLVGGNVIQIFNVLGNEYDLLILGEAKDPRTLHRIDAICKREGYPAKTHPAIPAAEYTQLVEETNAILNNRMPNRPKREAEEEREA